MRMSKCPFSSFVILILVVFVSSFFLLLLNETSLTLKSPLYLFKLIDSATEIEVVVA